jgi:hypothetical protein
MRNSFKDVSKLQDKEISFHPKDEPIWSNKEVSEHKYRFNGQQKGRVEDWNSWKEKCYVEGNKSSRGIFQAAFQTGYLKVYTFKDKE